MKAMHTALAITLSCAALAAPADAAALYTLTIFDTFGGASGSAYGINDNGQIAGSSRSPQSLHAALWNDATTPDLGGGSVTSQANDLNNNGLLVGYSAARASVWSNGTKSTLGQLANVSSSIAYSANDSGLIVGYSDGGTLPGQHAVMWNASSPLSAPVELGRLPSGASSYAQDINNAGQIVGAATIPSAQYAAVWDSSSPSSAPSILNSLGGSSYAYSINDAGQIVGYSTIGGNQHAVLWDDSLSAATDLGVLENHRISQAFGINESGQIVGFSSATNLANGRAVIWENNVAIDLNTLIEPGSDWILKSAESINVSGQIVGTAISAANPLQSRAFLLDLIPTQAVPEPATWAMMISGFGFIGAAMRRRTAQGGLQAA